MKHCKVSLLALVEVTGDRAETLPNYVTARRQRFFSYNRGAGTNAATANITASGVQWRIAPQCYYYFWPVGFYGEYVLSSQEVRRAAGSAPGSLTVDYDAWNVAVSYVLTGEKNTFNRIDPKHPFTLGGGGWGAWEIAARFGELSIDRGAYPFVASPLRSKNHRVGNRFEFVSQQEREIQFRLLAHLLQRR